MTARRTARRLMPGLVALFAALAPPPPAAAQAVLSLTIESAGGDGAAQGLVLPSASGARIAGAVLWPAPEFVEGRGLPPGTLAVAARAVQDAALAGAADTRPLLEFGPGFLALGADVPAGDEARLFGLLARLATPNAPPAGAVEAAARDLRQRREERWADPLERGRVAALGLIFPGATGSWNAAGTPAALDRVTAPGVAAALAEVRRSRVELRVAGPAGLASRAALALGARVGRLVVEPPGESEALPASAVIPTDGERDESAIVLGFRIYPEVAPAAGPPLAVLIEALSEGQGSLPQRLRVASNEGVHSSIEVIPTAGGGGVLVIGARTRPAAAATAWRVLDGIVSSLRSLPLSQAAVFRARQRLDEQAGYRASDALSALTGFLRRQPWSWPPPGERSMTATQLRDAAKIVLQPERRVTVVAGRVPAELASAEPLKDASRIEWSRLDPFAEGLGADAGDDPEASEAEADAAVRLATTLQRALAPDPAPLANGFVAVYRVREITPLGDAETELRVDAAPGATVFALASRRFTVHARGGEDGAEAQVTGAGKPAPLPEPERLPALLYRQPSLFAAAAAAGTLPVRLAQAKYESTPVVALRGELPEGTVVVLLFVPGTHEPGLLRTWFMGGDPSRPPDEEVRYTGWTTVAGIRIAQTFTVADAMGTVRTFRLVDWSFKPAAP